MAALVFSTTRADRLAATTEFAGRRASALAIGCVVLLAAIPSIASALPANDEVLATVDGESFTRTQMESEIGVSLEPLRHSIYQLEIAWVQKRVDDALLASEAKAKGMKVEELLATRSKDRARLLNELAQTHRVELFLRAPKVRWLKIDLSTAKLAGPVDAPVQIVVFSDFQCRFCAQLAGVLKRIRAEFPETVLIAYRYFPLENHPRAMPAAVAAECAAEQGKFWEYHDRLFAEGGDLTNTEFLNVARTLGLDGERFRECQNADRSRNIVEMSRKDAEDHGLEGAPTIALNGRIIGGMVSYERLVAEVRKELTVITRQKPSQ